MTCQVGRSLVLNWVCSFTSEQTKAGVVGEEFSVRESFKDSSDCISPEASPIVASYSSLSIQACTVISVFLLLLSMIE